MRLFGWGKKLVALPAVVRPGMLGSASPAAFQSAPRASQTAGAPAEAGRAAAPGAVLEHFADLGDFQRVLSEGADAVYAVPAALADRLLALDLGAKRATIFLAVEPGIEPEAELLLHVRSLRTNLRAAGYALGEDRPALTAVLRVIRRNPGQRTHNAGKGGPLELFLSWVNIAEAMDGSDMHCEIRGQRAQVRVRVDGLLAPLEDGNQGRYSAQELEDAVGAGYNSTRKGVSGSQWVATELVSCMIGFNTPRASGQLRYQNIPGRLGPKVVVRILRSACEAQPS